MVGAFIRNARFGTEVAFAKGLRRIGHVVNEIDPSYPDQHVDPYADATVIFKWVDPGPLLREIDECRGAKVLYQPDDARFPHIREMVARMREHCDLFLSFDENSADVARLLRYKAAETLLLTADDELYSPSPEPIERDIDVSFVGSLTQGSNHTSRMRMCKVVREESIKHGWQAWFGEAYFRPGEVTPVDIYRRSKVVLNHATDLGQMFGTGFGLQCRHFEVGMTRTALLSNAPVGGDYATFPGGMSFPTFNDEWSLISQLEWMLGENRWKQYADVLYEDVMSEHLPQHRALQLVDFITRNS